MDELIIEEKKYISSKQAAKLTGYAKDYIGQLCREGRVPARLVGRGWYVLESAIQDHRFGGEQELPSAPKIQVAIAPAPKTLEAPRYEAVPPAEVLPSLNRLRMVGTTQSPPPSGIQEIKTEKEEIKEIKEDQIRIEQQEAAGETETNELHESWKTWFDTQSPVVEAIPEPLKAVEEEVVIPIHIRSQYPVDVADTDEIKVSTNDAISVATSPESVLATLFKLTSVLGTLVAVALVAYAVLASGYFDSYAISHKQVGMLSGISVYNK